jgi:hypothetical protein
LEALLITINFIHNVAMNRIICLTRLNTIVLISEAQR